MGVGFCILYCLVLTKGTLGQYDTIVTLSSGGQIGGAIHTFEDDQSELYYQYKGIPYAEPVERFALSVPKTHWSQIHDGTVEGKVCPQPGDAVTYPGAVDEHNCLVLTITTSQDPNAIQQLRPVLAFYPGGAFIVGTTHTDHYDPQYLALEGIIVVQIQYRLGGFGWVSDGELIPRNLGLKDCLLGLQWLHDNIAAFGGDPTLITIFGESAGSVITSNLWQTPRTRGLINAAIMQSGTSVNTFGYQMDHKAAFKKFLMGTSCRTTSTQSVDEQVACLRATNPTDLGISSGVVLTQSDILQHGFINGLVEAPILEDASDPNAIITMPPLQYLLNGDVPVDVPVLLSVTNEEMFSFLPVAQKLRMSTNEDLVPAGMQTSNAYQVGKLIKEHYAGSVAAFPLASDETLVRVASDITFYNGYHKFMHLVQPRGTRVYCMMFDYGSPMGLFNALGRVGHGDDLFYTWKMNVYKESVCSMTCPAEAYTKRKQINRFFANFAKTGIPTPTNDMLLEHYNWLQLTTPNREECLDFKVSFEVIENPRKENYDFWDNLYATYGSNPVTF